MSHTERFGAGWADTERVDGERKDIVRDQDDADREREGKREAAANPAGRRDPRGDRKPPEPFSGPTR